LADALRAAVVLAVSALDAFVRTFVIDRIITTVTNPNANISTKLREQIKNCMNHDTVIEAARTGDFNARLHKGLKSYYATYSFQGVDKISDALKLVGHDDAFGVMAGSARVNAENLKRDLGTFTQRRHIIAHRGDLDLDQNPPVENRIRKADALKCIKTVELIAKEIAKLR
jgi:hypothetical protein